MPKMVIIGSNSFAGSHLADFLLNCTSWEIVGISRSPEYPALFLPYLYKRAKSPRFNFFQLNINTQLLEIIRLLDDEKPEVIVNFAAQGNVQYSWTRPVHWLTTNTIGVANLALELAGKKYLKKFVQISTPEIYGFCQKMGENIPYYDPSTPYAVSKAAGDMMLRAISKKYGFPVCFVRSTNFYGPHQQLYRIIPRTIIYLKLGKKIPLHGGGVVKRDFVHIYDVVSAIKSVVISGKIGNVYHISFGELISIKDLVRLICKITEFDFDSSVEISNERTEQDPEYDLSSEAKTELGWTPRFNLAPLGIATVFHWIEDNWEEIQKYPLEYIHKE